MNIILVYCIIISNAPNNLLNQIIIGTLWKVWTKNCDVRFLKKFSPIPVNIDDLHDVCLKPLNLSLDILDLPSICIHILDEYKTYLKTFIIDVL